MERERRRKERREEKRKEQEKNSASTKRTTSEMERQGTGDLKGKKKNVGSGGRQAKLSSPSKKSVVWGTYSNHVLSLCHCLCPCLCICLSVCLSVCLCLCLSYMSHYICVCYLNLNLLLFLKNLFLIVFN